MLIWLTALIVMVIGLSLLIHTLAPRVSTAFRFVLRAAAFAGSASVLLWLFLCTRTEPGDSCSTRLATDTRRLANPGNLPIIYALIAFLDRRRQLDPRDPWSARERSRRRTGGGGARRCRPAADRDADQAADDQKWSSTC